MKHYAQLSLIAPPMHTRSSLLYEISQLWAQIDDSHVPGSFDSVPEMLALVEPPAELIEGLKNNDRLEAIIIWLKEVTI